MNRLLIWVMVLPITAWAAEPGGGLSVAGGSDADRLLAGEVVLEQRGESRRQADATVTVLVDAPARQIWEVITSCQMAHVFVAGLRECEVIEERGDYALTRQVVDKGWTTPRLDYTFETRRVPYRSMSFQLVDGNLKELRGHWQFEVTEAGLLVRHALLLEPLVPAPRWLVRRNILKDLPGMMRCIRVLAGGSGTPEQERADRAECPGEPQ